MIRIAYFILRPLQNGTFFPISLSGSNFNPRNIQYIPVVEIFAFLEREQKLPFFKGLIPASGTDHPFRVRSQYLPVFYLPFW